MNAAQIAQYMRRLIDDPGTVGFPYSVQATMLEQAYEEFRQYVPEEVWMVSYVPPALAGAFSLDLSGKIFGSNPAAWAPLTNYALGATATNNGRVYLVTVAGQSAAAGGPTGTGTGIVDGTVTWSFLPRGQRICRIEQIDPASGKLLTVYTPAPTFETLGQVSNLGPSIANSITHGTRYYLQGTLVYFNVMVTGTLRIWYKPQQSIKWAQAIQPGADVYVDDQTQWHDVIALLAAQAYAIKEGQANAKLDQQLQRKISRMEDFYAQSRTGQASRWVQDERWT